MILQQFQQKINTFIQNNLNLALIQSNDINTRYTDIIGNVFSLKQSFGIELLLELFNQLDAQFRNSSERKSKYHIKAHNYRTILTVLVEVRFKRTVYQNKFTGEYYTYLGLDKYKYLDPKLEALLVAKMASYSIMRKRYGILLR